MSKPKKINKVDLSEYSDQYGFIGHKHPEWLLEFGDGSQRTGSLWVFNFVLFKKDCTAKSALLADQLDKLLLHTVDKGGSKLQYVRHWDATHWPGQPWVMSRDNLKPLWFACLLLAPFNPRVRAHLDLMTKMLTKRWGFLWNYKHIWPDPGQEPKLPDAFWPWDLLRLNIRAKKWWWLYPALCVCDFDSVVNSVIRIYKAWRDPHDTSADLNHSLALITYQLNYWTPTIWLAKMIYKLRPPSAYKGTNIRLRGLSGVFSAWSVYFGNTNAPPMHMVGRPVFKQLL